MTLRHEGAGIIMADYSAGHITTEEAREIIQVLDSALARRVVAFTGGKLPPPPGEGRWGRGRRTYPPHDWTGRRWAT